MSTSLSADEASELRHDLRTCVNQIGGYCGLLRDELPGAAAVASESQLADILRAGDELLRLLSDHLPRGGVVTGGDLTALRTAGESARAAIESACVSLRGTPACTGNPKALVDVDKIERAVARWAERLADGC